ncbi:MULTISPECIES: imm11 family protein [Pseudomonas]|jgi:hypothetical protein|uniref:Immunity MXAN-0049 protein domain-containing protein n=2 Tax=Pseudomonas fluorescens TaxID=294 RepID=A0ABY1TAB0_PSEFL|nr:MULTISPECIES: DUF1629 domain-containing protein [Pseudomonas]MEA3172039.1 hypothetical protein [Pseudomonas sp.]MBC8787413.1 hypothetical protein [Pseudomonas fluorescens]MBK5546078.1 hypothetical protein [Pseudomonas sp. TH04]MCI4603935.1 hypothetical protein [Pseudomonas fluorescens]NNB71551.1 hypothetical protein [Pseudomonas fluorescens]
MKYYLLRQDLSISGKWVLGDVRHVDNWNFSNPPLNFMEPGRYTLDVRFDGVEIDYSLAGYASVPVLSERARNSLIGLSEVDQTYHNVVFEPVDIEGKHVSQNYFLMIIETQIDCVDEESSRFTKFSVNDPVRPDMAGQYRAFYNLAIDESKVGDFHIFRIKKYLGAIVVSEDVKLRFEAAGVVGAVFESVNGDKVTVA